MSNPEQKITEPMTKFKTWLTVSEIVALHLPGAPTTRMGMYKYFNRISQVAPENFRKSHPSANEGDRAVGRGQGERFLYTFLPPEAIVAYEARFKPVGQ